MEKELRFADLKHDKVEPEMFVICSTHLQGSALRFECRPLETQLQDVSETFWFCPCLKDYRWVPLGFWLKLKRFDQTVFLQILVTHRQYTRTNSNRPDILSVKFDSIRYSSPFDPKFLDICKLSKQSKY